MAVRGTEGTAADRRETHCSFQQGSLQRTRAFLGGKHMVNTHVSLYALVNTALVPGA